MLWQKNMNKTIGTRREIGVFLQCKRNLRKFQSDLLAIFSAGKYNKTIKNRRGEMIMKRSNDIEIVKQTLKRNQIRIIVWILAIIVGLTIGGYAGVQAYYHGWLG